MRGAPPFSPHFPAMLFVFSPALSCLRASKYDAKAKPVKTQGIRTSKKKQCNNVVMPQSSSATLPLRGDTFQALFKKGVNERSKLVLPRAMRHLSVSLSLSRSLSLSPSRPRCLYAPLPLYVLIFLCRLPPQKYLMM